MTLNKPQFLLQFGDNFLCCFVFFPLTLCYWRGTWDITGVYLNPDYKIEKEWMILGLGSCTVFGYFFLPMLKRHLDPEKRVKYVIVTRVYMYFHGAFYMMYWRGVWSLGSYYLHELPLAAIGSCTCLLVLGLLRGLRLVILTPFYTALDTRKDLLDTTPRFGTEADQKIKYVCDSLFSHFVLITASIIAFQSTMDVYGHLLLPDNPVKSDVTALTTGYILGFSFLLAQHPLKKISVYLENKRWIYKLIWEDIVYLLVFLCVIFMWRGGWNLNSRYIIADKFVGGWVNHAIGAVGLMALQLFSYASSSGVVIDGADPLGKAFIQNKYLRAYCSGYLERKQVSKEPREKKRADGRTYSKQDGYDNSAFSSDAGVNPGSYGSRNSSTVVTHL